MALLEILNTMDSHSKEAVYLSNTITSTRVPTPIAMGGVQALWPAGRLGLSGFMVLQAIYFFDISNQKPHVCHVYEYLNIVLLNFLNKLK